MALLSQEFNLSLDAIYKGLERTTVQMVFARNGIVRPAYNVQEVRGKMNYLLSLPRSQSGIMFIDGSPFVSGSYLAAITDMASNSVAGFLKKSLSNEIQYGRGDNGRKTGFYPQERAEAILSGVLALPKVNRSGVYIDSEERAWVTKRTLVDRYKTNYTVIDNIFERLSESPSTQAGRGRNGDKVDLYKFSDIEPVIERHFSLPRVDKETGRTTITIVTVDQQTGAEIAEIVHLISTQQLRREGIPFSELFITTLLADVAVPALSPNGRDTFLYPELASKKRLEIILARPEVNEQGEYLDENGVIWVSKKYFEGQLPIYTKETNTVFESFDHLDGRKKGLLLDLYRKSQIIEHFAARLSLPVMNEQGIYVDSSDQSEWMSEKLCMEQLGISGAYESFRRAIAVSNLPVEIRSGLLHGIPGNMYSYAQVEQALTESGYLQKLKQRRAHQPAEKAPSISWIQMNQDEREDFIIERAKELVARGVRLEKDDLLREGQSALYAGIYTYFKDRGGMLGLREILGVSDTVRTTEKWSREILFERIHVYIDTYGADLFTVNQLKKIDPRLLSAIVRTGGMIKVKNELAMEQSKHEDGFWSQDTMFEQAAEILASLDDPTTFTLALVASRVKGLATAIRDKYEGGMIQLKHDLGLAVPERHIDWHRMDPEETMVFIEQEVLAHYLAFGVVTPLSLRNNNQHGLLKGIYTKYPGGLEAVLRKLELVKGDPESKILSEYEDLLTRGDFKSFAEFLESIQRKDDPNDEQ